MTTFFWLTLVASILALFHSLSKGDNDPWAWAKVVLTSVIMIVLIVVKCNTGDDPLDPDDNPSIVNPNYDYPDPGQPHDPFKEQSEKWQQSIPTQLPGDSL